MVKVSSSSGATVRFSRFGSSTSLWWAWDRPELDGQAVRERDAVEGDVAAADEGGTLGVCRVVLVGQEPCA